jgi:hypothetical protein
MKNIAVVADRRTRIAKATRGAARGRRSAEIEDVVVGCGLPEGATATTSRATPSRQAAAAVAPEEMNLPVGVPLRA